MTATAAFQDEFWSALRGVRTGLLTVTTDAAEHVAPMTAHFDEPGPIWFYAPARGVLAVDVAKPHRGRFLYVGPDHGLFATADADLSVETDAAIRARFWSAEVEAWFPGGPDQDGVAMLRCELGTAHVWLGSARHELHSSHGAAHRRDRRATVAL